MLSVEGYVLANYSFAMLGIDPHAKALQSARSPVLSTLRQDLSASQVAILPLSLVLNP